MLFFRGVGSGCKTTFHIHHVPIEHPTLASTISCLRCVPLGGLLLLQILWITSRALQSQTKQKFMKDYHRFIWWIWTYFAHLYFLDVLFERSLLKELPLWGGVGWVIYVCKHKNHMLFQYLTCDFFLERGNSTCQKKQPILTCPSLWHVSIL